MKFYPPEKIKKIKESQFFQKAQAFLTMPYKILRVGLFTILVFYFTLIISSNPVTPAQFEKIDKAIELLAEKGFEREVFLLRNATLFRNTDNWLNSAVDKENAFASTNCPFGMITIYPDFYDRAADDTERAMILLHEVQHLQGTDEREAYSYVWQNRHKLGWTMTPYGTTETYVTIELQTREHAPELFTCPDKLWNDCTEKVSSEQ
jgi:hypothetical protein